MDAQKLLLLSPSCFSFVRATLSTNRRFRRPLIPHRSGHHRLLRVRKLSPGRQRTEAVYSGKRKHGEEREDFGARGDGSSDDTKAFAAAWKAACSSSAPVTVLVPEGRHTGSSPSPSPVPARNDSRLRRMSDWDGADRRLWMLFDKVDGLRVEGGGTIDGNGQVWWKVSCKVDSAQVATLLLSPLAHSMGLPAETPSALTFQSCRGLTVTDLKFKNSQQMHVTFSKCANVRISRLTISAPGSSPNTDGIHVSGSTDVKISDSVIRTGDDCISIVSGSRSITATNIVCGPGHGIRYTHLPAIPNSLALRGLTLRRRRRSVLSLQGGKGYARNIIFRNIVMDNVKTNIIIDQNYCDSPKSCGEQKSAVAVSGVTFKNVRGTSATAVAMDFDCSRTVPCRGITLQDVHLVTASGAPAKSFCATSACQNTAPSYRRRAPPDDASFRPRGWKK
ncbi:unnamed protein product [Spirodela intermedia]|uniref:Polygalacturonase n=1 Tax=Spirodela intermedia TaxID=51605 RepID=A0ABN7EC12_SPIIN|nr:unnamed protein product [Spirodela intermedia]